MITHLAMWQRYDEDEAWCGSLETIARDLEDATCMDCLKAAAEYGHQCHERMVAIDLAQRADKLASDHPDPTCDARDPVATDAICTCGLGDDVEEVPQYGDEGRAAGSGVAHGKERYEALQAARKEALANRRLRNEELLAKAVANAKRRESGDMTQDEIRHVDAAQKYLDELRTLRDKYPAMTWAPQEVVEDGPG